MSASSLFDVIDDSKFIIFLALTKYFVDVVELESRRLIIIMKKLKKFKFDAKIKLFSQTIIKKIKERT